MGGDTKNSEGAPAFKTVELFIEFRFELETELSARMPRAAARHRAKACRRRCPPRADAVHPKPLTFAQPRTFCDHFRAAVAVEPAAYFWRILLRLAGALWEGRTPTEKCHDPAPRKTSARRNVLACGLLSSRMNYSPSRKTSARRNVLACGLLSSRLRRFARLAHGESWTFLPAACFSSMFLSMMADEFQRLEPGPCAVDSG